eukprot:5669348-Amphidinium_carterae.1
MNLCTRLDEWPSMGVETNPVDTPPRVRFLQQQQEKMKSCWWYTHALLAQLVLHFAADSIGYPLCLKQPLQGSNRARKGRRGKRLGKRGRTLEEVFEALEANDWKLNKEVQRPIERLSSEQCSTLSFEIGFQSLQDVNSDSKNLKHRCRLRGTNWSWQ